jgi:hypothetical protein
MTILYYIIKVLVSSALIVLITEIAKRNGTIAGLIASIPLVSLLAIIWLYLDTKDIVRVRELSISIFWLVLPSLAFFLLLPYLLRKNVQFWWAMLLSTGITVILYIIMMLILKKNWS